MSDKKLPDREPAGSSKGGQFKSDGNGQSESSKTVEAVRKYSSDPERDIGNLPSAKRVVDTIPQSAWENATQNNKNRVKVGEITNPIYDDMVLSTGRRVKDILTRVVEMPLTGPVGAEHIEGHPERKGIIEKYRGFMDDIINDPDYVFEDRTHENTLQIEKQIDEHTIMTISLNYDNPEHTNTVITMRNESEKRFKNTKKVNENFGKVLYKKPKA